jgi:hypothetical protein
MSGAKKIMRGLDEAKAFSAATPPGGFGSCPFGAHVIGPWDTSFTGGSEGVSCRRCHKTWLKVDGVYVETYAVNFPKQAEHD